MGWHKRALRVNLTTRECHPEPIPEAWLQAYLGLRGLATKYLTELMDPSADAMGPDNVLIFATGPLTGTMASTGGRFGVITKGPLTNAIACSNSGGKFGAELKFAGYDLIIIEGRAATPVYLHIHDQQVTLRDATALWGHTVWHTEEQLRRLHQEPSMKVASIGVAGEQGVRYACVVNDLHRAAGRSGVGAVMGSKNLKAIAVRGTQGVIADDMPAFAAAAQAGHRQLAQSSDRVELTELGTNAMIDVMQQVGGLPTRNFQAVQFEGVDGINPAAQFRRGTDGHRNHQSNHACFGCTIACGRMARINKNHFSVRNRPEYHHASGGLEYETAFAFGPVIGVDDIDALTFAGYLMNEHGMDPISFGVTLAAAMELFELGIITTEHTDGIELNFGSAQALVVMAEKTGKQQGFGKTLGLGSLRMCTHFGRPELSMSVKGQEFAGYDSRALQGMGLGYATSNRGACHLKHDTFGPDLEDVSPRGKALPCKVSQDQIAALDSSGVCLFTAGSWGMSTLVEQINAACAGNWTETRLVELGERVWNLERQFNLRAGLSRLDDTLPPRLLHEPAPSGIAKGKVCELEPMLNEYYTLRGWDDAGVPTAATLARLGLT
jgi:aldehyde:ferredoxin oxidoreductase